MRMKHNRAERTAFDPVDPREEHSAEVIDLTTRKVLPSVSQRSARSDGLGMGIGIAVVAALGVVTLWSMNGTREVKQSAPGPNGPMQVAQPSAPPNLQPRPTPPMPGMPLPDELRGSPLQPGPVIANAPQPGIAAVPQANPITAPVVVFDASAMPAAEAAVSPAATPGTGARALPGTDDFAARIGGVGGSTATAKAMVNPRTTVTQGTLIPAVLETAINTDVPGYTRAVVSADVRSFDGSRVLIPRSSRLIGEYKSGLQAGQKRAYVVWTRLIRPDGASVNLASPAITFSGEAGLAGSVNNHFFARFGSAMLLSVLGGLSALGGGGGTAIIAGGGQSAAAAAVGQNGQIGPTVRVMQGEPVRVFTARDLDFSKVTAE